MCGNNQSFVLNLLGVSSFFDSLSHSLRENIAHVATAAGAVVSDAPEPVFDRMQVVSSTYQRDNKDKY